MRQGNNPALVLTPKGDIFAIATGIDATAEHEWGSEALVTELTGAPALAPDEVAAAMSAGRLQAIPNIHDSRKILFGLEDIVFQEGVQNGEEVAAIGFSAKAHELHLLNHPELVFRAPPALMNLAGAWNDSSFAFKVKGAQTVARLKAFHKALQDGKGMFASQFLRTNAGVVLKGVVLCNTEHLQPEHRLDLAKAQSKFASNVRLHQLSRASELQALAQAAFHGTGKKLPSMWPIWHDEVAEEVHYGLNPGQDLPPELYGHYSFEELRDWFKSGAKGLIRVNAY